MLNLLTPTYRSVGNVSPTVKNSCVPKPSSTLFCMLLFSAVFPLIQLLSPLPLTWAGVAPAKYLSEQASVFVSPNFYEYFLTILTTYIYKRTEQQAPLKEPTTGQIPKFLVEFQLIRLFKFSLCLFRTHHLAVILKPAGHLFGQSFWTIIEMIFYFIFHRAIKCIYTKLKVKSNKIALADLFLKFEFVVLL